MRIATIPRLTRPRLTAPASRWPLPGRCSGGGPRGSATAATAATATPAAATAGHTTSWGADRGPKPTIVLVHGAWADNSSWDAVVERLQALGYTVDVPPNPLRGVSSDSAYLSDFLSTISGPIVLVGHSYGGFVITDAATGDAQVKALVYDDAFIPATGDIAAEPVQGESGIVHQPWSEHVLNFVPYPGSPSGDADLYVKFSVFPGCFANGLPAGEGAALAAEQLPLAASALSEPLTTAPGWQTIPSWAIVGTADHVIPRAELLAMAHGPGRTSHRSMPRT